MNEELLKEQISVYKLQLQQVITSLKEAPYDIDLTQLRDNLTELIQLSEETLKNNEKSTKPQKNPDSSTTSQSNETLDFEAEWALFQAEVVADKPEEDTLENALEDSKTLSEELSSLVNSTCQAPFSQKWGEFDYFNAIISEIHVDDDVTTLKDVQVSVIFCNPVCTSMQPCPFYLEGRCNYKNCRYSHGHLVRLTDLRPFKEPDYSCLERDSSCLVKHSDDLWYKAKIQQVDNDDKFIVKFDNYDEFVSVDLADIFPLDSKTNDNKQEEEESSEVESFDEEDIDGKQEMTDESNFVPWILPAKAGDNIGDWEAHTKGIGSKLLLRMGYISGRGLGKNLEGRVEPVEAVVLPAGKSLDKIMELKESNKLKPPGTSKKHKSSKKNQDGQSEGQFHRKKTIFDFINTHLGGKNFQKPKKLQQENLKSVTTKGLNVQLLKIHEEIKNANKEIRELNVALARNKERDKIVAGQLTEKLSLMQKHLGELHQKEKTISREQEMRTNKQKLSVF